MPLYAYAIPDLERIQKGRGWIYLEVISSYGQRSHLTLVFRHDKFKEVYRLVGYGWTLPEGDEKPVMWIAARDWEGKLSHTHITVTLEQQKELRREFSKRTRNMRRKSCPKFEAAVTSNTLR